MQIVKSFFVLNFSKHNLLLFNNSKKNKLSHLVLVK